MGRRPLNRVCAINYPSRVEGWLDVCEVEGVSPQRFRNLPWGPLYCVLQQDEQAFTAYCSEEISIFPGTPNKELTDILFTDLPRVRLDRARKPHKIIWDGPPTVEEEPEDSDGYQADININTTLSSDLGECKSKTLPRIHFDTSADSTQNEGKSHDSIVDCICSIGSIYYKRQ